MMQSERVRSASHRQQYTAATSSSSQRKTSSSLDYYDKHGSLHHHGGNITTQSNDDISFDGDESNEFEPSFICSSFCLQPSYSLRRQLNVGFGLSSLVTVSVAVVLAIMCTVYGGNIITTNARAMMTNQVSDSIVVLSKYEADIKSEYLGNFKSLAAILIEAVRDRIQLLPQQKREQDVASILTMDNITSASNNNFYFSNDNNNNDIVYPIRMDLLPELAIQPPPTTNNTNESTSTTANTTVSKPSATYKVYRTADAFYTNATTTSTYSIDLSQQAADISVFLKPLHETNRFVGSIQVAFFTGSMLQYPGMRPNQETENQFTVVGCDWIHNTTEYYSDDLHITQCTLPSTTTPQSIPLSQAIVYPQQMEYCQDQIQNPKETRIYGPYRQHSKWWLSVGQAIFDRRTKLWIGCTSVQVPIQGLAQELLAGSAGEEYTNAALVKLDGTIVAGGGWDSATANSTVALWDLNVVDQITFQQITSFLSILNNETFNANSDMAIQELNQQLEVNIFEYNGRVVTAYPVPTPPKQFTGDPYHPEFLIVLSIGGQVFDVIDGIDEDIAEEVYNLVVSTVSTGFIGLLILIGSIMLMSWTLTAPLEWMDNVSSRIVSHHHHHHHSTATFHTSEEFNPNTDNNNNSNNNNNNNNNSQNDASLSSKTTTTSTHYNNNNNSSITTNNNDSSSQIAHSVPSSAYVTTSMLSSSIRQSSSPTRNVSIRKHKHEPIVSRDEEPSFLWLTPRSEVTQVVAEFRKMIKGASGKNISSTVAKTPYSEIFNQVGLQSEFFKLQASSKRKTASIIHLPELGNYITITWDKKLLKSKKKESKKNKKKAKKLLQELTQTPKRKNLGPHIIDEFDMYAPDETENPRDYGGDLKFKSPKVQVRLSRKPPPKVYNSGTDVMATEPLQSPLFWWIFALIILPLLVVNAVICYNVSTELLRTLPSWSDIAKAISVQFASDTLNNAAILRASFADAVVAESSRDLHLLTRVAGFVLFNAVQSNPIFGDASTYPIVLDSPQEECKVYPPDRSCPFYLDEFRDVCECSWNDAWGNPCQSYNIPNDEFARSLQTVRYACQARDTDPIYGNRQNSTSFPEFDSTADTTLWWDNIYEMPGAPNTDNTNSDNDILSSNNGNLVSLSKFGFTTAFERARAAAAMGIVFFPIFNYAFASDNLKPRSILASYVAFDADGGFAGYAGCGNGYGQYAHFKSSESNGAYLVNSDLCPLGKHGYDPRCRGWYSRGQSALFENGEPAYFTPPYVFAAGDTVGLSAGSAIVDPETGELVAQTLIDLIPGSLISTLVNETASNFTIMISPQSSAFNADAVIGPGYSVGDQPRSILDVVLPFDVDTNEEEPNQNRKDLQEIATKMKEGRTGQGTFMRTFEDGTQVPYRLSYAPVTARMLTVNDPLQDAMPSQVLLFSVGIAEPEEVLEGPFRTIEKRIDDNMARLTGLFFILIVVICLLSMCITIQISYAITRPMIVLLRVVQNVNDRKIKDDLPPLEGGSREVNHVYHSFSTLYKIVRIANTAFFSGDLDYAYDAVYESLSLFRKMNHQKAIAISCNNLGNIFFAMSREGRHPGLCKLVNGVCCVRMAKRYLDEAVFVGTCSLGRFNPDSVKAMFAQQLADRLFNRALFLLHSLDDPCIPKGAREQAYSDLRKTRDLDIFVRDYWRENRLLLQNSDRYFERLIRRLYGMAALRTVDETIFEQWNVNELVTSADRILSAAWDNPAAPIFRELRNIGRLQQLESTVTSLELSTGNIREAARIGIRMIVEDDYILEPAFAVSAEALLKFGNSSVCNWESQSKYFTRCDILNMLNLCSCNQEPELPEKAVIFCFEVSDRLDDDLVLISLSTGCTFVYDNICNFYDHVGVITSGNPIIGKTAMLLKKGKDDAKLRSLLIPAASAATNGHKPIPALPLVCPMLRDDVATIKALASNKTDKFLIYVADGSCWEKTSQLEATVKEIETIARKWTSGIHIIVIGLEIVDVSIIQLLRRLAQISPRSIYVEATRQTVNGVLSKVGYLLSTGKNKSFRDIQLGITMEKF